MMIMIMINIAAQIAVVQNRKKAFQRRTFRFKGLEERGEKSIEKV